MARTWVILLAEVPCDTWGMARRRKSRTQDIAAPGGVPIDLYDYAHPSASRSSRKVSHSRLDPDDPSTWTVRDDWPEEVPVTDAEIEVFETWFGDLFDELFSTRH
jgi:hypothetical protein